MSLREFAGFNSTQRRPLVFQSLIFNGLEFIVLDSECFLNLIFGIADGDTRILELNQLKEDCLTVVHTQFFGSHGTLSACSFILLNRLFFAGQEKANFPAMSKNKRSGNFPQAHAL
jgi:hypothetical protein